MGDDWCLIESDPGVFTELIEKFGVKDVQVEEVWDMDEAMSRLSPIYGYIFLFKYQQDKRTDKTVLPEVPGLFYAKQMITNACATQAIVSVLLNRPEIEIGSQLSEFKDFTQSFAPADIGSALATCQVVREAHNSFRRQDPFQIVSSGNEKDDAFHFISYVPHNGVLYELDGLQPGVILHGECTTENWLEKVKPVIQERMASYQADECRFTLLAITKKLSTKYKEEMELSIETKNEMLEEAPEFDVSEMDGRIAELQSLIKDEEDKCANWTKQNTRRRHNYIPFILEMLKKTARAGVLPDLIEAATERKKEKVTAMKEREEKKKAASEVKPKEIEI